MVIVMFALGSTNNTTVSHKFQVTNKRRQLRLYGEHRLFFMKITKAFLWQCGTNQNVTSTPTDSNVSSQTSSVTCSPPPLLHTHNPPLCILPGSLSHSMLYFKPGPVSPSVSLILSPSCAPVWAPAGTLWARCRYWSSCSQRSAPSGPHSRSSHSGCPERPGDWRT